MGVLGVPLDACVFPSSISCEGREGLRAASEDDLAALLEAPLALVGLAQKKV